jgi:GNAT superfamily N-acetyltransferase
MHPYSLRPATDDDRDRIAEIWHSSASLPNVGPPVMPSYAQLRQRVDEEMASGWCVTVATEGQALLGFVAMRPGDAVLAELFVCPKQLGKGVGKMLLEHAKAETPGGFSLFTTSANSGARRFYEREGLVALREATHPRAGHPVTYYGWLGGAVSPTG